MMKTVDDLDPVSYSMLWNYLEDLDKLQHRSIKSMYGKISELPDINKKIDEVNGKIKELVMKHHLYDHDWNLAVWTLKYIYCKRSENRTLQYIERWKADGS